MSRRPTFFLCGAHRLGATIDDAAGDVGLLIVNGGTQTRIGAHRGMARLAAAVAAAGHPVFRFDRRGVGESEGDDPGFADSGPDIAAAAAAFRHACPQVRRIIGFGLCDGATALALHHAAAGIDGVLLANPWTVEPQAGLPPPAAIRARYMERLFSVKAWWRLLSGGIDYRAAARGLRSAGRRSDAAPLATAVASALSASGRPVDILLASGDATALAFDAEWRGRPFDPVRSGTRTRVERIMTGSHSFASGDDPAALARFCLQALAARN